MTSYIKQELSYHFNRGSYFFEKILLDNNLNSKFEQKNIIEDNLRTTSASPAQMVHIS